MCTKICNNKDNKKTTICFRGTTRFRLLRVKGPLVATSSPTITNLQALVKILQTRLNQPKPILSDPIKFDSKIYYFDT
jgi:hypothetical protein